MRFNSIPIALIAALVSAIFPNYLKAADTVMHVSVRGPNNSGVMAMIQAGTDERWSNLDETDSSGNKDVSYTCGQGQSLRAMPKDRGTFTLSPAFPCYSARKIILFVQVVPQQYIKFAETMQMQLNDSKIAVKLGKLPSNLSTAIKQSDYGLIAQTSFQIFATAKKENIAGADWLQFELLANRSVAAQLGYEPIGAAKLDGDRIVINNSDFENKLKTIQPQVVQANGPLVNDQLFSKMTGFTGSELTFEQLPINAMNWNKPLE